MVRPQLLPSFQPVHSPHLENFPSSLLVFLHFFDICSPACPPPAPHTHRLLEQGLPPGKAAGAACPWQQPGREAEWWPGMPHPLHVPRGGEKKVARAPLDRDNGSPGFGELQGEPGRRQKASSQLGATALALLSVRKNGVPWGERVKIT